MQDEKRDDVSGVQLLSDAAPAPTARVPRFIRSLPADRFGWRHVKGVSLTRFIVAVWCVVAGSILLAYGNWLWGASTYAAAVLVGAFAFLMPHWKLALDAETKGERVRELERSRANVVDDAAARLRRIEQDLHDGAQAQMVAVVMRLGLAREHLASALAGSGRADVERSLELVEAAHRGATEAITELRDLAHGIHPSALDEGLGGALETLAARSDVPVELDVTLAERPSPAIETIAYFCVAELFTNVAKHSGARRVRLEASQHAGLVRLRVSDDGGGGALVETGGGLAGLAERVRSVDGRLTVISPVGGPTLVTVELPLHA